MAASYGRITGWDRAGKLFILAADRLHKGADGLLDECAEIYMEEVKAIMHTGLPEWPRLHPQWIERKGHDLFYLDTGEFSERLTKIKVKGSFAGQKLFVGATPYQYHDGSGKRMDDFAQLLQVRYQRPLFGPAWERAQPRIRATLDKFSADILR